jgi:hypothetical protein
MNALNVILCCAPWREIAASSARTARSNVRRYNYGAVAANSQLIRSLRTLRPQKRAYHHEHSRWSANRKLGISLVVRPLNRARGIPHFVSNGRFSARYASQNPTIYVATCAPSHCCQGARSRVMCQPTNIRLINRRSNLPGGCPLCPSRKRQRQLQKHPTDFAELTQSLHIRAMPSLRIIDSCSR